MGSGRFWSEIIGNLGKLLFEIYIRLTTGQGKRKGIIGLWFLSSEEMSPGEFVEPNKEVNYMGLNGPIFSLCRQTVLTSKR